MSRDAPAPPGRPAGARLAGTSVAFPPAQEQEDLWQGYFGPRLGWDRWARRVFLSAGVRRRHLAVDPTVEDVAGWSTGARMARYLAESLPLAKAAVTGALEAAGLPATEVGLFCVASCTGYATPGVDVHLARDLGMGPSVERLLLGHMGCHAALPGLGVARDYVIARRRPAVLLCVEVCSLHAQPPSGRSDQLVAHALFSDAAAAAVVTPAGRGAPGALEVVDVAARADVTRADHMTWDVTDLGFRMGLSRRVPDVLGRHVRPLVEELLARNQMTWGKVAGWAVHPGGPRVLDVVADRLALGAGAVDPSRQVLAEHGNCSSATVLVVLDDLLAGRRPAPGEGVVALAFGPGLTASAALLRAPGEAG